MKTDNDLNAIRAANQSLFREVNERIRARFIVVEKIGVANAVAFRHDPRRSRT